MRSFAIAFTKEKYQLAIGIDKDSQSEIVELAQFADQTDSTPNLVYFYFLSDNVNQGIIFKKAQELMFKHFMSELG